MRAPASAYLFTSPSHQLGFELHRRAMVQSAQSPFPTSPDRLPGEVSPGLVAAVIGVLGGTAFTVSAFLGATALAAESVAEVQPGMDPAPAYVAPAVDRAPIAEPASDPALACPATPCASYTLRGTIAGCEPSAGAEPI